MCNMIPIIGFISLNLIRRAYSGSSNLWLYKCQSVRASGSCFPKQKDVICHSYLFICISKHNKLILFRSSVKWNCWALMSVCVPMCIPVWACLHKDKSRVNGICLYKAVLFILHFLQGSNQVINHRTMHAINKKMDCIFNLTTGITLKHTIIKSYCFLVLVGTFFTLFTKT